MFTHRDSRAGDPDLHTHVAVSNKVQTTDGRWLALDGRMLYRFNVAASEFYNSQLEAEVTTRIGGTFLAKERGDGKRPVRELAGVDDRLTAHWSRRREAIETVTADLAAQFVTRQGRVPTAVETLRLAQQATLQTRAAKHEPRSLNEQRRVWRAEAIQVLGGEARLDAMLARRAGHGGGRAGHRRSGRRARRRNRHRGQRQHGPAGTRRTCSPRRSGRSAPPASTPPP